MAFAVRTAMSLLELAACPAAVGAAGIVGVPGGEGMCSERPGVLHFGIAAAAAAAAAAVAAELKPFSSAAAASAAAAAAPPPRSFPGSRLQFIETYMYLLTHSLINPCSLGCESASLPDLHVLRGHEIVCGHPPTGPQETNAFNPMPSPSCHTCSCTRSRLPLQCIHVHPFITLHPPCPIIQASHCWGAVEGCLLMLTADTTQGAPRRVHHTGCTT
eukprot:1160979-Pelagomonas_calceolata.AAC.8